MCAQYLSLSVSIRRQIKGVMFLACRMLFGNIQRGKILIVGFDVWPFSNAEAHLGKDGDNLFDRP